MKQLIFQRYRTGTREPKIDYYEVQEEKDPFPVASNLGPDNVDQKNDVDEGFNQMLEDATQIGISEKKNNFAICQRITWIFFAVSSRKNRPPQSRQLMSNYRLMQNLPEPDFKTTRKNRECSLLDLSIH